MNRAMAAGLTEVPVARHLALLMTDSNITRHALPGIHAFSFVCAQAMCG